MQASPINFSLEEKLAIVQALDSVIHADGIVHSGEINALSKLMYRLDFETNFIVQARNLPAGQGILLLDKMSKDKKYYLAEILDDMATADGHRHQKEMTIILDIFKAIGFNTELKQ